MNIIAISIGSIIAVLSIRIFRFKQELHRQVAYAYYLASFPLYYWIFALFSVDYSVLYCEILIGLLFIALATYCALVNTKIYPIALGSAYLWHAVYDIHHNHFFVNSGIPEWWPEFCGVIDIILGLYLLSLSNRHSHTLLHHQPCETS